jgi:SEC-C motif
MTNRRTETLGANQASHVGTDNLFDGIETRHRGRSTMTRVGRNQPCPCGSGLKYKRCHGSYRTEAASATPFADAAVQDVLDRDRANEKIREAQQGLGRPIISFKSHGHQIVAIRNTLYWSDRWKTFLDFLADYFRQKIGSEWGNAEIAKPLGERHPILEWYDALCHYQRETIRTPGEASGATVTGLVACYLGLAYSLYLLDHNVEIQERLIRRLKDRGNFQGAFYELFVANTLIRAGFELTLEDEADGIAKHCEFAAVSRRTGKKYWVEAKMKAVAGLLGQTQGTNANPISRLIPHLNDALAKPAADERLIFIDLNAEPEFGTDLKPAWHDRAIKRLEQYEARELGGVSLHTCSLRTLVFTVGSMRRPRLLLRPLVLACSTSIGQAPIVFQKFTGGSKSILTPSILESRFFRTVNFQPRLMGACPPKRSDSRPLGLRSAKRIFLRMSARRERLAR